MNGSLVIVTALAIAIVALGITTHSSHGQETGYSLRFYGNGVEAPGQDRVLIPIDAPERPADIGATDFTIEFWLRALPGENSGTARCHENDGWIYGSVVIDRDIFGAGDYGDFGISLGDGRMVFGVSVGSSGTTVCSVQRIDDGEWHHVAAVRRVNGEMLLFIDGALTSSRQGAAGNASYRNGRSTDYPADRFLVVGAEKHDAGAAYPSFSGWLDELRLSNSARYSAAFDRPVAPFVSDSWTVALYHFDEGPVGACSGVILDSSDATGGPSHGSCVYGGSPAGPNYVTDTPFAIDVTPTVTPPSSPTVTVAATVTATPSNTPLPTSTATATASDTPLPTSTATATASDTPLPTSTATATASDTPLPTSTATATASDTPLPTPTATVTATATSSNTPTPDVGGTIPPIPTETPAEPVTPNPTSTVVPTPCLVEITAPEITPSALSLEASVVDLPWSLFLPLIQRETPCVTITR